jgi:hypothetical protein
LTLSRRQVEPDAKDIVMTITVEVSQRAANDAHSIGLQILDPARNASAADRSTTARPCVGFEQCARIASSRTLRKP